MIELMERILDGFRLEMSPAWPAILVPHVTVTGAAFSETQPNVPVEVPSLSPEAFRGFTYTALGHIHKRQTFSSDHDEPLDAGLRYYAHYPGSMDRRDFGEEREEKSWDLVTIDQVDGRWQVVERSPRPLPARRFLTLSPTAVRRFADDRVGLEHLLGERPVLRVKGNVSAAEAEGVLTIIASWGLPVGNALEVKRELRARDTEQTGVLSPSAAVRRYFEQREESPDEIDALMTLHGHLSERDA
jgi:exonuclease SbcD